MKLIINKNVSGNGYLLHPKCMNINIPESDTEYVPFLTRGMLL